MSKLSRLRDNIAALQEAFEPKNGEYDYEVLEKYSGFGGLGFEYNDHDTFLPRKNRPHSDSVRPWSFWSENEVRSPYAQHESLLLSLVK